MMNVFEAMLRSMGECAIFDWGTWSQRDHAGDADDRAAPAVDSPAGDVIIGKGAAAPGDAPREAAASAGGAAGAPAGRRASFSDPEPIAVRAPAAAAPLGGRTPPRRRAPARSPVEFMDAEPGPSLFLVLGLAGVAAVVFAEVVRLSPRLPPGGAGALLSAGLRALLASASALCARAAAGAPAAALAALAALIARLAQRAAEARGSRRCPPLKGWAAHARDVDAVRAEFAGFLRRKAPGEKLSILRSRRGANPSNRTTEAKYKERATPLDVSALCDVIEIDRERMLIHVEPGVAMDFMARLAMAHGVVPQVVLEFPGITVGGAVCGGGIESSSHIFGSFVDTVEEMDVLTGSGEFRRGVTRESDPDLFFALSTSFGTIGIITRVAVRVLPSAPYVHVRYAHTDGARSATELMERMAGPHGAHGGAPDFIDAVALAPGSAMVVCGSFAREPPAGVRFKSLRSRRWDDWFFWHLTALARGMPTVACPAAADAPPPPPATPPRGGGSSEEPPPRRCHDEFVGHEEYMPLEDFLFRFDRGAFWMARPGLELFYGKLAYDDDPRAPPGPHPLLRIKYAWLCTTRQLYRMLHRCGDDLVARMFLVQDFIMPSRAEACSLVDFSNGRTGIWCAGGGAVPPSARALSEVPEAAG